MSLFEKIYITLPSIFKSLIPKDASYFFFQKDICQNFKIWSEHIQQFNSTLIWGLNFSSRQLHFLHAKFTLPSPIDHMFQRSGSCASVAKHDGCFIHLVPMLGCPWPCFQLFFSSICCCCSTFFTLSMGPLLSKRDCNNGILDYDTMNHHFWKLEHWKMDALAMSSVGLYVQNPVLGSMDHTLYMGPAFSAGGSIVFDNFS